MRGTERRPRQATAARYRRPVSAGVLARSKTPDFAGGRSQPRACGHSTARSGRPGGHPRWAASGHSSSGRPRPPRRPSTWSSTSSRSTGGSVPAAWRPPQVGAVAAARRARRGGRGPARGGSREADEELGIVAEPEDAPFFLTVTPTNRASRPPGRVPVVRPPATAWTLLTRSGGSSGPPAGSALTTSPTGRQRVRPGDGPVRRQAHGPPSAIATTVT